MTEICVFAFIETRFVNKFQEYGGKSSQRPYKPQSVLFHFKKRKPRSRNKVNAAESNIHCMNTDPQLVFVFWMPAWPLITLKAANDSCRVQIEGELWQDASPPSLRFYMRGCSTGCRQASVNSGLIYGQWNQEKEAILFHFEDYLAERFKKR